MSSSGFLMVVSSPSGGGKTTLCRMLVERRPDVAYSVSATTRPMRSNEKNGKDYYFMTEEEFDDKKRKGYFAETAFVHNFRYGTPVEPIIEETGKGMVVIMDLDVQGAKSIMERFPDSVTVFILPPSMDELEKRLMNRKTDDEETIRVRLRNAQEEIKESEKFKYRIINENLDRTYEELSKIINEEKKRRNK